MTKGVYSRVKPSYARIVRKYVLRGVHPLSAKAQADIWLQVKTAKERREGRVK